MTRVALVDDLELDLGVPKVHAPPSPLALTNLQVAKLTRPGREKRVGDLIEDSRRIYADAVQKHFTDDSRQTAAVVALFSGGNDSTVATHLFRDVATHTGHANTTVGIEATRQFVRDTSARWGIPLLERTPPRLQDQYRALVLDLTLDEDGVPMGGFPGPALHWKQYQRLKLRAIERMQAELIHGRGRTHRVLLIAGRRRDESRRRASVPEHERSGSRVWVSPMVHWTKFDLNTYRLLCAKAGDPIPVNDVAELIHMSGECLCGSYASPGERAQLDEWFYDDLALIRDLERELRQPRYASIPEWRKTWGWAAIPELAAMARAARRESELRAKADGLCQSCNPYDPDQGELFAVTN